MKRMKNKQAELIKNITDQQLLKSFYFTQLLVFEIAIILAFFLFNHFFDLFLLFNFSDIRIITYGVTAGILVVAIDLFMMKLLPSHYFDDGGINVRLFQNRGVVQIIFMTLLVAFCEELLFRGVLQTQFGLLVASLIFALIHYRYLFNPFLLISITFLSFFIGLVFEWTQQNLAVTFIMHFIIDVLLGLFIYFFCSSKKSD